MAKRARRETFISRSRGVAPSLKAAYHNETGAGKSRVIREFFGLSATDLVALTEALDRRIANRGATTGRA
jgi:hypothetical protein